MTNLKTIITTFISLFCGAVVAQLQTMSDAGHLDFSTKSLAHMATAGVVTAIIAVYHLYQTPPSRPTQQ